MSLVSTPPAAWARLSCCVQIIRKAVECQASALQVQRNAGFQIFDSMSSYTDEVTAPSIPQLAVIPSSSADKARAGRIPGSTTVVKVPAFRCSTTSKALALEKLPVKRIGRHAQQQGSRADVATNSAEAAYALLEQHRAYCRQPNRHNHRLGSMHSPHHSHEHPLCYTLTHSCASKYIKAAHTRCYASHTMSADPLSQQLLSCKGLGTLRRIMLKYKANMGPEQVANTLLSLQHLVLQARQQYGRQRQAMPHPAEEEFQHDQMLRPFTAHGQPRVRAAQNLGPATTRVLERDGPTEQLTSQVLGELGNMIWHYLEDMSGPDLAKLLYSWAKLNWHPESQLLEDVTASFLAAAVAGSGKQHSPPGAPSPPLYRGPRQPWLAAGLWGLCRLEQPLSESSLRLLVDEWMSLLQYWRPQQLVDVVWVIAATADERTAAEATEPVATAAEGVVSTDQLQVAVLGLAQQYIEAVHQSGAQQISAAAAPVWPESLLPLGPTAESRSQQQPRGSDVRGETRGQVWRLLQAVAAVGIDVSDPPPGPVSDLIRALNEALQPQTIVWR